MNLLRTAPFRAINYCTYDACRAAFAKINENKEDNVRSRTRTVVVVVGNKKGKRNSELTNSGNKEVKNERKDLSVIDLQLPVWQRMTAGFVGSLELIRFVNVI